MGEPLEPTTDWRAPSDQYRFFDDDHLWCAVSDVTRHWRTAVSTAQTAGNTTPLLLNGRYAVAVWRARVGDFRIDVSRFLVAIGRIG